MAAERLRLLIGGALPALVATDCMAHVAGAVTHLHVHIDAVLASALLASAVLYARGVTRLWRKAGVGRGIRAVDVARFGLGIATLAAALLPPIDALAGRSFATHMIEHEMLMVIAAPLFVLARPLEASAWALPGGTRRAMVAFTRSTLVRRIVRSTGAPVFATCVHALALWIWHLPPLFLAALASTPLHVFQHVCFFASALAFWWAMFGGAMRTPGAVSVACLFATMLHTSALGALLAFAPSPWYVHDAGPRAFGLTPLEDQQLGGLIMWVPCGLAYVVVALSIVGTWLSPSAVRRRPG
ncbi:MAG TPA: cytochrome c oxidase assembly protein [Casimicrobiaceae bacterium]|nr:cytochrome c oxidase assembly protein [Casimicrobiaceae bacterium]